MDLIVNGILARTLIAVQVVVSDGIMVVRSATVHFMYAKHKRSLLACSIHLDNN